MIKHWLKLMWTRTDRRPMTPTKLMTRQAMRGNQMKSLLVTSDDDDDNHVLVDYLYSGAGIPGLDTSRDSYDDDDVGNGRWQN